MERKTNKMVSQKEYDDLDKKYTFAIVLIGIFFVVLLVTLINLYSKIIENQELKQDRNGWYLGVWDDNKTCWGRLDYTHPNFRIFKCEGNKNDVGFPVSKCELKGCNEDKSFCFSFYTNETNCEVKT